MIKKIGLILAAILLVCPCYAQQGGLPGVPTTSGGSGNGGTGVGGQIVIDMPGVNFNSANTDTVVTIPATPNGAYQFNQAAIYNCTAALGIATYAMFTAASAGGTAITTNPIPTAGLTSSTVGTTGSLITASSVVGTVWYNQSSLFFRVIAAQGTAVTCSVAVRITIL